MSKKTIISVSFTCINNHSSQKIERNFPTNERPES